MAENYFQFPLCALCYGTSAQERLNVVISFALIEAGIKLWRKLPAVDRDDRTKTFRKWRDAPSNFHWQLETHCAAFYGAQVIGVELGHFGSTLARHEQLRSFVSEFQVTHGRDALVRIKRGWLFDTRDGNGITYREFSVLCAIYSAIGDKELAIVTRDRIRRCALGYRTAAIMQAEQPKRTDGALLLTERQLRDTITRLHRNKFFARCTVARRITYYSIRLDSESLRKKILERRTYADFFHASQSAQDQALTAAIKQKRREATKSVPKPPPVAPRFKFTLPGQTG